MGTLVRFTFTVSAVALFSGCSPSQTPLFTAPAQRAIAPNAASETVLYSFAGGKDGAYPKAAPILIKGNLYGTTALGGNGGCSAVHGCGTVYSLSLSGRERLLHVFKGSTDGEAPAASLVEVNRNLLGTTVYGGRFRCKSGHTTGCGTVFQVTPSGKERVLFRFPGGERGAMPVSNLTLVAGALYGEAAAGGTGKCYYADYPGCGAIFKMGSAGRISLLYTFKGGKRGGTPQGGLLDYNGNFYGTTSAGGDNACMYSYGCGTAFEISSTGTQTTLHEFGHSLYDAALPEGGLVLLDGAFYGTTFSGGRNDCALSGSFVGCGTVFRLAPSGKFRVIYSFKGLADGSYPNGLIAVNGKLYGTAEGSGRFQCGTIFEMTRSGHETTLYQFKGTTDGCGPASDLIYAAGTFYGTTEVGGKYNEGTVFAVTP